MKRIGVFTIFAALVALSVGDVAEAGRHRCGRRGRTHHRHYCCHTTTCCPTTCCDAGVSYGSSCCGSYDHAGAVPPADLPEGPADAAQAPTPGEVVPPPPAEGETAPAPAPSAE